MTEDVDARCQTVPATMPVTMAAQKTKRNPLGSGRNPRAGKAATNKVTIRLTDAELAAFADAATSAEQSLADWMRACCAARLKRVRK